MKSKIINTKLTDSQIGIFYLGQVGFIIKYNNKYIMIDGYLSDYVDRNCCSENVKWVRRYPAPINAEDLDFIDYVLCTHSHFDHADPDTLSKLAEINTKAQFIVPKAIVSTISSYGINADRIISVSDGENISLDDTISATGIKAAHEDFHVDDNGDYLEMGFVIKLGDTKIFHAGDGCPYNGLDKAVFGCDIMMLPINGRDYYRTQVQDIIGCFDSREAAILASDAKAKLLIPTHFDLYDVNCVNPAQFVDVLKTINPMQAFHMFTPGELYIYQI